ncbi:MAG: dienelactone hydrolase family protein [Phycisphaerales bacterium]|nr:MAG: dienelactone hydrolase family protein [Phycisphaerales bacterium]
MRRRLLPTFSQSQILPALVICLVGSEVPSATASARAQDPTRQDRFQKCTFTSGLDGATVEYALWLPPEYDANKRWPLIVFLHGSAEGANWRRPTSEGASIPVRTAKADLPFVVAYPLMRGSWSITTLAERDVLETIADVGTRASIDPDRIHLTGISLGGFAAWRIACRYPDLFATVSPFCGGGEPELAINLRHVRLRTYHGTADKSVSVKESRRMVQALNDADIGIVFEEMTDVGHACWRAPYAGDRLYDWMAQHRRITAPRRVSYRTWTLRQHKAYWASVESLIDPARAGFVDVFAVDADQILIHAENVARLHLTPPASVIPETATPTFFVNNQQLTSGPNGSAEGADAGAEAPPHIGVKRLPGGGWQLNLVADDAGPLRKRPGLSGPILDVYYDPFVVVVPGANGGPDARAWQQVAARALAWTNQLVFSNLRTIPCDQVTPEIIADANLICFGNPESHSVLRRVAADLPVCWAGDRLLVEGDPASVNAVALVMIYPNPLNRDRYIVVCSGLPGAAEPLAWAVLHPPSLSRVPNEDLVIVTGDGKLLLKATDDGAGPAGTWRSMADPAPPRGAVFDRSWNLSGEVKAMLTGVQLPVTTRPSSAPATDPR